MRSGDLLAYLSLNRLFFFWHNFMPLMLFDLAFWFSSCVTGDRPIGGPTNGRTNPLIEMQERMTHLKMAKEWSSMQFEYSITFTITVCNDDRIQKASFSTYNDDDDAF